MLEIYIASVLFSVTCYAFSCLSVNKEVNSRYTKEEMKVAKKMPSKYHPISTVIVLIIPVLNLAFGMIAVFKYGELRDSIINDIAKFLYQEKVKEKLKELQNNDTIDTTQK